MKINHRMVSALTTLALFTPSACDDDDEPLPSDATLMCTHAFDMPQPVNPGPLPPAEDDDVGPSPPSIGSDVPLTYFGPPPTEVNKRLIGPLQLLTAGTLDLAGMPATITLPLYRGRLDDGVEPERTFWYVVTDTTDQVNAAALGLNHSAKLSYADAPYGAAVRVGSYDLDGTLLVDRGAVDFGADLVLQPGPDDAPFPPTTAEPGAIGDAYYTPLVRIENAGGHIYNAPVIAFGEADELGGCDDAPDHAVVHDKVVGICAENATVTLALTPGFSFGRPVLYLSLEASNELGAALEATTFAPALANVPVGGDDSLYSAVERLFLFTNGPTGANNPQRQGLSSALLGEGSPLNVIGGIPTIATDYSPLWDMNLGEWTPEAIAKGYPARLTEEFQILGMAFRGHLTGPGGAAYGSTGIIVNCPIVQRLL